MSKVLVAYATKTGCTAGVADKVGETLSGMGHEADVASVLQTPDPSGYDAVIVGSGIRIGSWHGSARQWTRANADVLKEIPVAFFTTCMTMADEPEKEDEVRAYTDTLIKESGVEPVEVGLFAGWFMPEKFGFMGRTILRMLHASEGDHRDWDVIEAWTREVAPKLGL